ncbi:MAG: CBS domain-containing protein [Actinomycetales bacterium]|nr:CBS domain-containing protein [Actinomycetales bacterium]
MRAADLAEDLPLVTRDTDAVSAVRAFTRNDLTGVVVADADGVPEMVLTGTQLLRLAVPGYVMTDPRLAHVYDEAGAAELVEQLRDHTVGDLLDDTEVTPRPVPCVLPEDTVIELAALMCAERTPAVLVRDRDGTPHGVVTLPRLMSAILGIADAGDGRS